MYSHRHYIHVHIFHSSWRCPHFFIVSSMFNLFSCFLLVCLKNFEKIQKYVSCFFLSFLPSLNYCSTKKKYPKRFPCSSFTCWELSRVNSFSRFCFSLFICLLSKKQKLQKYFSAFLWISLPFYWVIPGRPQWKCWVALICIIDLIRSPYFPFFSSWI